MSPDSIDSITVNLYDFLVNDLGCPLDENENYESLHNWMLDAFEKYYTRDRNYN